MDPLLIMLNHNDEANFIAAFKNYRGVVSENDVFRASGHSKAQGLLSERRERILEFKKALDTSDVAKAKQLLEQDSELMSYSCMLHDQPMKIWRFALLTSNEIVKELFIDKARVNDVDEDMGQTPLHCAISEELDLTVIEYLLSQGACVDATDDKGWTAAHVAADSGNLEVLKLLRKNGADFSIKDNQGYTPFLRSVASESASDDIEENVLEYLLNEGSDINAVDKNGASAMHLAIRRGTIRVLECLVKKGADKDLADNQGCTPLMDALRSRKEEYAKYLLNQGADITIKNYRGWTALHHAVFHREVEVIRLILEKFPNMKNEVFVCKIADGDPVAGSLLDFYKSIFTQSQSKEMLALLQSEGAAT